MLWCCVLLLKAGEENIKKFSEFSSSKNEGVYFVVACYFDVVEGVDMWHHDVDCHDGPRFRLKIKVGDVSGESVFVLYDEVVKRLAPETCKLLVSMKEASSLYPDEMESMYGDPILFKVSKKFSDGLEDSTAYDVVDVCYDSALVGMFISQYLTTKSLKKSKVDSSSKFAEDTSSVGQGQPIDVVPFNASREEISMSGSSLGNHLIGVSPSTASHSEISKLGTSGNKRKFIDAFDEVEIVQSPVTSKDARVTTTYIILE